MKLHWSPRSPFVRKVMVFAHEAGLAGRIETVRTMAAMTQPNRDLMRINPLGKIPTLITDDGKVLFDSTVIGAFDRAGRRIASRHDNNATG
jgi:glutathione S-transferase